MTETLYGQHGLDTPAAFFAALLIGAAFGFALERAGFGSSRRLAGVFYFKDMAVVKVMFSAMLTAMAGLGLMQALGWIPPEHLHLMETVYGAHVVGGLLFGVGFVMSGWCPGTAAVGLASGKWDALVFLVGSVVGAMIFNESFSRIQPLYNWGLQPEPAFAFGLSTTVFAVGFAVVGVAAFYFSEWVEQRTGSELNYLRSPFLKAFSTGLVALTACLFIFPGERAATHVVARPVIPLTTDSGGTLLSAIASGADHIEPETLASRLVTGDPALTVVDVRQAAEFQRFHIRGAINVPLANLLTSLQGYRNAGDIVLYSNGMTHPAQARDQMVMQGFPNVYLLTDGLQGFLDHCLRPASLYHEPVSAEHADQIATWRAYFLADTSCPPNSFNQSVADHLQPVQCGSIARLNTVDGIYLASQPYPDDLRLAGQAGIKTVVSLRFPDEIDWNEAAVVKRIGLAFIDVPFKKPETLTDEVFDKTRAALNDKSQRPLLLHCHSANRVGAVWLAHRVLDDGVSMTDAEQEATSAGLKSPEYLAKAKDYIARSQNKKP